MEDLMDDPQKNNNLRPIVDDGEGDIPPWNKEIAKYFRDRFHECALAVRRGVQV
jgi:damage-control phosphatase, subfamily III